MKSGRTFSRGGELTTSRETVCHETLEEDGFEVGASEVHSGRVPSGTRTDDDLGTVNMSGCMFSSTGSHMPRRRRTTLECNFVLLGTVRFVSGAMKLKRRDRGGSCSKESTDAETAGNKDARRAFVRIRVRENRMTEAERS